ncbi:MAG: DUF6804 family protein [Phycisphaerae bacterium]|nr:DUF6804 family protein [Phycisphaerae bacterium]
MPRWTIVVLGVTALLLGALPFDVVPGAYEAAARWAVTAGLLTGAVVAGQRKLALWCGVFAAAAVLFQPVLAVNFQEYAMYVHIGAAVVTAVCVVRHW